MTLAYGGVTRRYHFYFHGTKPLCGILLVGKYVVFIEAKLYYKAHVEALYNVLCLVEEIAD
jgi:hypothetical protein